MTRSQKPAETAAAPESGWVAPHGDCSCRHLRAPQIDLQEGRRRGKGIRRCVVCRIRAASKATDTAWRLRFRSSSPAENQNHHAIISRGRLLPPRTIRFSFLRHFRLHHWLLCKPRDTSCEQHRAGFKDGGNTGWRAVTRAAAWLTEGVMVFSAGPDEDVGGWK